MARKYKRLSYADRERIEAMCKAGSNAKAIAGEVGVHRGTLYRELQRGGAENGKLQQYSAEQAQRAI
jgi:IS30 family transposase